MIIESINRIALNQSNELILQLKGTGNPSYQYVYREAAGVYWDEKQKGFKSTPLRDWPVSKWFFHIKSVVKEGLNVDLELSDNVTFENIPTTEQTKINNSL